MSKQTHTTPFAELCQWCVVDMQEVGQKKISSGFKKKNILAFKEVGLFYSNVSKTFIHLNYMNKTRISMLLCCILPRGFCMILFLKFLIPTKQKHKTLPCQVVDQQSKNIYDNIL